MGRTNPLLGVYEEAEFTTVRLPIVPGDQLLLYTDGVTDAPGQTERFGEERLVEALRRLDLGTPEIADAILNAIDGFFATQPDDIAVIGMIREGSATHPASLAA